MLETTASRTVVPMRGSFQRAEHLIIKRLRTGEYLASESGSTTRIPENAWTTTDPRLAHTIRTKLDCELAARDGERHAADYWWFVTQLEQTVPSGLEANDILESLVCAVSERGVVNTELLLTARRHALGCLASSERAKLNAQSTAPGKQAA